MSLFKKNSSLDVVDFTALQKRGILDKAIKEEQIDNEQSIKILQPAAAPSQSTFQTNPQASQGSDMFSAMDSLAGSQSSSSNNLSDSDLSSLKLKVEDLEFKLERLLEKLETLENSINHT